MSMETSREQIRAAIIASLVQVAGYTREQASEAFDLAVHATNEAERVTLSVCERASNGDVAIQASLIAWGMLAARSTLRQTQSEQILRELGSTIKREII